MISPLRRASGRAREVRRLSTLRQTLWRFRLPLLAIIATGVLLLPAAQAQNEGPRIPDKVLDRLSQGALIPYLAENPEQAPEDLGERLQSLEEQATVSDQGFQAQQVDPSPTPLGVGVRFNQDTTGLPQNEESITRCDAPSTNVVLGGTNDFRGLIDPNRNVTGWHFSNDGGARVTKEGRLPDVRVGRASVPSGGDPAVASDAGCNLYAASLAYDPRDEVPNGIAVYRSNPATIAACPGGTAPDCWPRKRMVAKAAPGHFLDKEWMHVGTSASGATVVWTVYTDFGFTRRGGESSAIKAVRCNADLSRCTDPINVSGTVTGYESFVQYSDVTVADEGRAFVTWTQVRASENGFVYTHKLRVSKPGSKDFGPARTVYVEPDGIPFGGGLNANSFRAATLPKSEVRMVDTDADPLTEPEPKVFVVWDACGAFVEVAFVCEEPVIKLNSAPPPYDTWSDPTVLSQGGSNYFPAISANEGAANLAVAYFTNRQDAIFDNRQDVELVSVNPETDAVLARNVLTAMQNEPEADPLLGAFFIGDYIEVYARNGTADVHYNANYVQMEFLNQGVPVAQQDNFLISQVPVP